MDTASLVWITPNAEQIIAYCARVSSSDQNNPSIDKLIRYCYAHKHWSIFEQACMCVELQTSRAIATQVLRHRSFSFQQFSQRYQVSQDLGMPTVRRQDTKNRQNSIDDLPPHVVQWWHEEVKALYEKTEVLYATALSVGIAKESARFILPESTQTKMYMTGSIRSWIHYLEVRANLSSGTQLEHYELACQVKGILVAECPIIGKLIDSNL